MNKYTISDNAVIEIEAIRNKTTMLWKGAIDTNNFNDVLGEYLFDFHGKCKEQGIAELDLNFHQVDFMNSSGIKYLIIWLRAISDDNQYKITVNFNPAISWQDATFETFAKLLKNVEFKRK